MDPTLLINDIVEHDTSKKKPVEFDDLPISSTGFPQHKRRWKSSFKQRRAAEAAGETAPAGIQEQSQAESPKPQNGSANMDLKSVEKQRIDQENKQKLASMSPAEIAEAQADIMNGLNPALIQRLLARANIDEQPDSSPFDLPKLEKQEASEPPPTIKIEDTTKSETSRSSPAASSQAPESSQESKEEKAPSATRATSSKNIADDYDEDKAPPQIPPDLFPIIDQPKSIHFPVPPALADLDPSDPNFLTTLHEKYFPNLPADPSKLAWMAPIPTEDSPADKDSSYYPHPEIAVNALRFDFRGRFLSPRVSRAIPSSKGLHHHGDAPEAAGYTVAELAHLARSAVPAQRCMAFQTLGRILYRLGLGEWGKSEDSPIAMGVWGAVKKGRVLDSLTEAAMGEGGHRGSRAYATEALWLFEKGGWREKFKGR
ncbi:related to Plasmodium yoelii rhoptry protein [Fusarium torulosum]|uniref:Related to Plasmodium yoelii rhoptry protein n=1 Tax=Fusarium torulosum TaxID=33205 RepID=A0AAE8MLV3_9HYPO|nr:related to Plasmodium yoelii rhoptry protein [Fusarium torulosum]